MGRERVVLLLTNLGTTASEQRCSGGIGADGRLRPVRTGLKCPGLGPAQHPMVTIHPQQAPLRVTDGHDEPCRGGGPHQEPLKYRQHRRQRVLSTVGAQIGVVELNRSHCISGVGQLTAERPQDSRSIG